MERATRTTAQPSTQATASRPEAVPASEFRVVAHPSLEQQVEIVLAQRASAAQRQDSRRDAVSFPGTPNEHGPKTPDGVDHGLFRLHPESLEARRHLQLSDVLDPTHPRHEQFMRFSDAMLRDGKAYPTGSITRADCFPAYKARLNPEQYPAPSTPTR